MISEHCIRPLKLTQDEETLLKAICAKLLPEHTFDMNNDGIVTLTKGEWLSVENVRMHWYELAFRVLVPMATNNAKYATKYIFEDEAAKACALISATSVLVSLKSYTKV